MKRIMQYSTLSAMELNATGNPREMNGMGAESLNIDEKAEIEITAAPGSFE